jgi:DNA replication and repair protein RecF
LASGPSGERRALLDRIMIHQDPAGASARVSYQKALRDRQKILLTKGPQARELDAYEQVVATQGARFAVGRIHAANTVIEALGPAFARMAPVRLLCEATYQPGGCSDAAEFAEQLRLRRPRDLHRGSSTFGPHRDELHLVIDGRPARSHASQGQQRLLTLSLKMAELSCVREVTGMEPMLLLDDVSSELDPERTDAVFELLRESKSQIFVTTTRPELFSEVRLQGALRADFRLVHGALSKSQSS